jgi:octaprenyl-diphosphate synthase
MFAGWEEYRLINEGLDKLADELPSSGFGEVIRHVLSSPGKRVRPLILVTSSQAFGGDPEEAMDAALAVELVHAASLVHDDILDCGVERRGEPSALERYGRDAALLCGDYLISRSIDLISGYRQPVIKAFSAACMKMSQGEMLDLSNLSSQEEYYRCISAKTASLFAASAKMGCLIACAGIDDVSKFEVYGQNWASDTDKGRP